jgi:hypothetical protein
MQTIDNKRLLEKMIQQWTRLIFGQRDSAYASGYGEEHGRQPPPAKPSATKPSAAARPQRLGAILTDSEAYVFLCPFLLSCPCRHKRLGP